MTRSKLVGATSWSAALAGGIFIYILMRAGISDFGSARPQELYMIIGSLIVAMLMADKKEGAITLENSVMDWLMPFILFGLFGAFVGLICKLIGLFFLGLIDDALRLRLSTDEALAVVNFFVLIPLLFVYLKHPKNEVQPQSSE